jgi:hypothetical protein
MHWPMHQALRCHARSKRSGVTVPSASGEQIQALARMARDTMAAIEP